MPSLIAAVLLSVLALVTGCKSANDRPGVPTLTEPFEFGGFQLRPVTSGRPKTKYDEIASLYGGGGVDGIYLVRLNGIATTPEGTVDTAGRLGWCIVYAETTFTKLYDTKPARDVLLAMDDDPKRVLIRALVVGDTRPH